MKALEDRRYTQTHEWVKVEGDIVLVGITYEAQEQLGDMVYVGDVPVGEQVKPGDIAGVVESVKAASDIYAPVSGEILEFNEVLEDDPALINEDAYGVWIYKMKPEQLSDVDALMQADQYNAAHQE